MTIILITAWKFYRGSLWERNKFFTDPCQCLFLPSGKPVVWIWYLSSGLPSCGQVSVTGRGGVSSDGHWKLFGVSREEPAYRTEEPPQPVRGGSVRGAEGMMHLAAPHWRFRRRTHGGWCVCVQGSVQMVLKRLEDVQEMFEKRHVSLKRLSAKQTRPIQPVAPRPDSSPKRPSVRNPPRNTGSQQCELGLSFSWFILKMIQCNSQWTCTSVLHNLSAELCSIMTLLHLKLLSSSSSTLSINTFFMFSFCVSAFARRASDNSNTGRQAADVDPNKKKNIRKNKAGIKVQ